MTGREKRPTVKPPCRGGDGPSRRGFLGALGAAGAVGLAGCLGSIESVPGSTASRTATATATTDDALSGRIAIAGSSTVYPLTLSLGKSFSEAHPDVTVSVASTGTGGGFADFFCAGRTVVNDASRAIEADERDACAAADIDPVQFRIATDAVSVVVNPDADWVDCLTLSELAAIWRVGGASSWSDVRPEWPDEPIRLAGPTTASGTFDYFSDAVLPSAVQRTDHLTTEQDTVIAKTVGDSMHAMGYFGLAYYLQNRDTVRAVPISEPDGCVLPSPANAKNGRYDTLSRPLYVYVAREALSRPEVAAFVRYYLERSTSEPAVVGYVPVTEETAADNLDRLDALLADG